MSYSKKNNKKSKKNTRKNYKIESLEPRLLMDATAHDWETEIDGITIQNVGAFDDSNFYLESNWDKNGDVAGLRKDDGSSQDVENISKAEFIKAVKNEKPTTESVSSALLEVQNVLKQAIWKANGGYQPTQDVNGNWSHNSKMISAKDVENAFKELNPTGSYISADNCTLTSVSVDNGKLVVFSTRHFGGLSNKNFKYHADVRDDFGIEGEFDFKGVNQHYEFLMGLDGDSSTSDGLITGRFASAVFNEQGADAKFGVLGLNADTDADVDLYVGTSVKTSSVNPTPEYGDGLVANFSFGLKDSALFSTVPSSSLSFGKMGLDAVGYWSEDRLKNADKVTMGRVLGKLRELSSAIANVQESSQVNFGGMLASNVNGLMNLPQMLDDVLNARPQTIQELVNAINTSDYSVNKNVKINVETNGDIKISFNLEYIEYLVDDAGNYIFDTFGNKIQKGYSVALSEEKIKNLFPGINVRVNDDVTVESTATLSFDLIVPQIESVKAEGGNTLEDIGISGDSYQLGSIIGANAAIGGVIHHWLYTAGLNILAGAYHEKNQTGGIVSANYCTNNEQGIYAVYCDSKKEIDLDNCSKEMEGVAPKTGFVLQWNSACTKLTYGNKTIVVNGKAQLVDALNSIFAQDEQFGDGTQAIEFDNQVVILYADDSSKMGYLNNTSVLKIDKINTKFEESELKNIWISQEIPPTQCPSSFNMVIKDGVTPVKIITFEKDLFDGIKNVADIAVRIQDKLNQVFLWGEYSPTQDPIQLYVEAYGKQIRFCTTNNWSIDFGDQNVAAWLGFSGSSTVNLNARNSIEIKIKNISTPYYVDLSGFAVKTSRIEDILNYIVSSVNTSASMQLLEVSGLEIKIASSLSNTYAIERIDNYNGYHIASLLGLTGDVDDKREAFCVDSTLTEKYLDFSGRTESLVRLDNLELIIENEIRGDVDGEYSVGGNYGVFGVNLNGNLQNLKATTVCTLDNTTGFLNEMHGLSPTLSYDGDASKIALLVTPGVKVISSTDTDNSLLGGVTSYKLQKYVPVSTFYLDLDSADFMEHFGQKLTMEVVYKGLYDTVSSNLMKYFFGSSAKPQSKVLEDFDIPLQGKNVLELMGLRGKINEMAKCLDQCNGATLQELSAFFAQKLGVTLNFSLSKNGLGVDIIWNKVVVNQKTELGGMDFGTEDFNLGGCVEAYLNMNLFMTAHIDIVYDGKDYKTILSEDAQFTNLKGYVYVSAEKIVTDMNVNVVEVEEDGEGNAVTDANGDVVKLNRQKLFQIGDSADGKNHSHLFMIANVGVACDTDFDDEGNPVCSNFRQAFALRIGGELYAYRYGISAGSIKIGLAKSNDSYNNLSCWDNNLNNVSEGIVGFENGGVPQTKAVWNQEGSSVYKTGNILANEIVVDMTGLTEKLEETFLYEKLRQVADGLSDTVRRVQSNLNTVLGKKDVRSIPLVGDSILSAADSLTGLYDSFVEPFRKYVYKADGLDARAVTEKLYSILRGLIDYLPDLSDTHTVEWAGIQFNKSYKGIQYMATDEMACWHLCLKGTYNLASDGDFDLGFAGLGLKAEGGVNIDMEWTLDIGFGISLKEGAFLLLSNGSESTATDVTNEGDAHAGDDFRLKLTVRPKASIEGSLGFLALNASLNNQEFVLNFGLDLNDGSNTHEGALEDWNNDQSVDSKINFSGIKSGLSVEAGLRGSMPLDMNMTLGVGGFTTSAPHIDTHFVLNWSSDLGGADFGAVTYVAFEGITFDAGSFIKNTIGNVVDKINKVLDPIRPLIKFLQSEIPVLNKLPAGKVRITVLDLVKKYGESKNMNFGFLDDIIELSTVMAKLNNFTQYGIRLSEDWIIYQSSRQSTSEGAKQNAAGLQYLKSKALNVDNFIQNNFDNYDLFNFNQAGYFLDKTSAYITNIENNIQAATDSTINYLSNNIAKWETTPSASASSLTTPKFSANFAFPLLDPQLAPKEVMKLLMGGHADLVTMDLAPLEFKFDWSKSFPIVGPLCADIGFGFGVCIDLSFGYDTYGLEAWSKSGYKNPMALLNGFYMRDWDDNNRDVAEIVFHSGITAGASVCGRAGINVGLNFNVNLDFIDPNNDGKIRISEMASMLSPNPLDTFDVSATIEAKAYAYLDYFVGRKEFTLWSSGAMELFSTASTVRKINVVTYLDNQTVVNVGEFAEYRSMGYTADLADVVRIDFTDAKQANISLGYVDDATGNENTYVSENCSIKGDDLVIYAADYKDGLYVTGSNIGCNIIIYGGTDDDVIDLSGASFADGYYAVIMGDAGNDIIKGAANGTNYIFGDEGIPVYAKKGSEKKRRGFVSFPIDEGFGTNVILGGLNARNIIFGGFGNDFIVAGDATDIIFGDGGRIEWDDSDQWNDLSNWNDPSKWHASIHDLFDQGGADVIYGMNGSDYIYSGAGDDLIDAGNGNDIVLAGQGNDTVYGASGVDTIYGGDGVDIVFGDTPDDLKMVIATSDDTAGVLPYNYVSKELKEKALEEQMELRQEDDKGTPDDTSDKVTIGLKDFITTFTKSQEANALLAKTFKSNDLDDYLERTAEEGVSYSDIIKGENGSDIIFGGLGIDQIDGGADNDFIDGNDGDDVIEGGSGDDIIYGGLGNDRLDGGADNDIIMGDKGWVEGYSARSDSSESWFVNKSSVFGDTVKAFGLNFGINQFALSNEGGGDDIISTGNGNDFVDGQSGNDTYNVSLKGGYYSGYTNIMDSGIGDEADSMVVNGTVLNDDILIRASDENLGMIAMLPNSKISENDPDNIKSRLERINYWNGKDDSTDNRGIERISVNTGAGNDKITVDSTISSLNVDAGAGDDIVTIGQLFDVKRDANDNTNILDLDAFGSKNTETTQGYLSDGANYASSFSGGDGNDIFNMLHTSAPISLLGGAGDDTFNVASYSYIDENGDKKTLKNSPVSVIGGVGNDSMAINGTEEDDTFVYTQGTVYTPNIDIQSVGVENQNANGGDGDDSFYVLDTPENSVYRLNGNNGNDSFYNGGVQVDGNKPKEIQLTSEEELEEHDGIDIVFVGADNKETGTLSGTVDEGGTFEYKIKLSDAPQKGEKVQVTIFAPSLTENNLQRGDRGIYFENDKTFMTLEFDETNYGVVQTVKIKVPSDVLREGNDYFALLHSVKVVGSTSLTKVNDCKNALIYLNENAVKTETYPNTFVETLKHVVTAAESFNHKFFIPLNALPKPEDILVWYEGMGDVSPFVLSMTDNLLTVEWPSLNAEMDGTVIYVHYNYEHLVIDNQSVVSLKYDTSSVGPLWLSMDTESINLQTDAPVKGYTYNTSTKTMTFDSEYASLLDQCGVMSCWVSQSVTGSTVTAASALRGVNPIDYTDAASSKTTQYIYKDFKIDGVTKYYDVKERTVNGQLVLDFEFYDENGQLETLDGLITYHTVQNFLANTLSSGITIANGVELAEGKGYDIDVQFKQIYVVEPYKASNTSSSGVYYYKSAGNQIVLYSSLTNKPITLSGTLVLPAVKNVSVQDENESNSLLKDPPEKITISSNTIENILGALYEDGAGEMDDFATAPTMLRYRELDVSSSMNERDDLPESEEEGNQTPSTVEDDFDEMKSVDRVFINNMDNTYAADSSVTAMKDTRLTRRTANAQDEKNLLKAEDLLLASDSNSVHFTHTDLKNENPSDDLVKNISFGNMEYGEINLGSDVDTTTISKTIFREDGFQTFTVLNSGEGGDTVVVDSYKGGEDDQLVINAGAGDDTVTANGDNVTKDGLIVFGGLGDDTIDVGSNSSLVFGDRGQVLYHDNQGNVVTRLGDDKTGSLDVHQGDDGWNAGGSDYATGKEKGDEAYYQTDGNRYGASIARTVTEDDGGDDTITLANGRNVVFGGLNTDQTTDKGEEIVPVYTDKITTGNGDDLVFGDNGYVTFRGHKDVAEGLRMENMPTVYDEAILSFNFQGGAQTGLNPGDVVGADDFKSANWNNIAGHLAGTYGNDDSELVYMEYIDKDTGSHENRTRVSAVSVSYGGIESHRNSSTDNRINLRPYELNLHGTHTDRNAKMMNSGLMTTAPSDQCDNKLEVVVDGLTQYFERYSVAVYLDLPDANSWQGQSVRLVSLYIDGVRRQAFFVNDPSTYNYSTSFDKATAKAVLDDDGNVLGFMDGKYRYEWGNSRSLQTSYITSVRNANYVVFDIPEGFAGDRIVIRVEDGYTLDNINGKDVPGIAGIQVKGTLRGQDVAASTNIGEGGADKISTDIGDDIVVGGTGSDMITTFGDERYGLYDNDVVFGDNAKMVFTDRDGDINTVSTISSAESLAVTNLQKSYDDKIYTGDGNDNVVGGIGSDHIEAGARTDAVSMMDNINVLSINFTREACDKSDSIAQGEAAGVVVDTEWHNFYRNDRGVIVSDSTRGQNSGDQQYNNMMDILCNNPLADNPYAVAEGVEVQLYGKNNNQRQTVSSFTIDNYDELDGDTSNAKLYNTYLAAQQSEEIVLKLKHMNTFVGNNVDTYDVYVYLGGDNNDTDTFNYIYDICLKDDNGRVHRYLNDWTGRTFDGDYLEAYCSSESIALSSLQDGSAPMVGLVGNYVVFHGVKGDLCDIRIKNLYTSSGQAPKNLPMISAVQIVAGEGRNNPYLAIGGDHDKDLVYGDDAKLSFDVDVPYAVNERLNNYQNRVIEAKSIAIDQTAVETIETKDTIITGKDRDVVVGGEGSDTIRMGDGDDIAIGSSANLLLEHNNPLGVFTPNTEIVLDQHTINTNLNQKYLDNDNSTESQFQNRLNQNRILGIDKTLSKQNDRKDDIQVGEGRNLVYEGSSDESELVVQTQTTTDPGTEQPGTDQPGTDQPGTDQPGTDQPGTDQPGTDQPGTDQPGTDQPETIEYTGTTQLRFNQPVYVNVKAGENIRLVGYTWDGINQWASNLVLRANASNGVFPQVTFTYRDGDDLRTVTKNQPGSGEEYYFVVDIPNGFNDVDEYGNPCVAVYVTASADTTFMLTFGCGNA